VGQGPQSPDSAPLHFIAQTVTASTSSPLLLLQVKSFVVPAS
jgi:hypothetical protein